MDGLPAQNQLTFRSGSTAKVKKAKKKEKSKLSFAAEEIEEDDIGGVKRGREGEDEGDGGKDTSSGKKRFSKNPNVDTSFLPDRQREEQERIEREELRKEWLAQQESTKLEDVEITYSYWDGSGHRKAVEVSNA